MGRIARVRVRSDKDTHFRDEIAQNAQEVENLPWPLADKLARGILREVVIISTENLAWEVILFGKDAGHTTDPDTDRYLGKFTFATTDAIQIAATGLWLYHKTDLHLGYEDQDASGEVHTHLVNRSAGAKTAAGPGALVVDLVFEAETV